MHPVAHWHMHDLPRLHRNARRPRRFDWERKRNRAGRDSRTRDGQQDRFRAKSFARDRVEVGQQRRACEVVVRRYTVVRRGEGVELRAEGVLDGRLLGKFVETLLCTRGIVSMYQGISEGCGMTHCKDVCCGLVACEYHRAHLGEGCKHITLRLEST